MAASVIIKVTIIVECVGLLMLPPFSLASEIPPPAYQLAAHVNGVPSEMLYAVALAESSMRYKKNVLPWPWTLNVAGEPRRFTTRQQACNNLVATLRTVSAKRVDVGIAQINYGYHGHRVSHPCDLLDPYRNLNIAASLLKSHYRASDGWLIAAGKYHSPANGEHARRYRVNVQKQLKRVQGKPVGETAL